MNRLEGRLKTLERKARASGKMPKIVKLLYIGDCKNDSEREERIKRAKSAHLAEYGTLDGLTILETMVPDPDPLPQGL
jgi:hypothetical protein